MDIKQLFKNYLKNKNKIKLLQQEIECIKNDDGLHGIKLYEKTSNTNKVNDSLGNLLEYKEKKITELEREIKLIQRDIDRVDLFLSFLDENKAKILKYKFMTTPQLTYVAIAHRLGYSDSGVRMVVTRALKELENLVN